MQPKIIGAWNLHKATRDAGVEFFVCFSSAASLLGSAGQGNYAAANAFMDSLMHQRRQEGLHGLSVNWGPWAEAGMASGLDSRGRERLESLGYRFIKPEAGLRTLEKLLLEDAVQAGVFGMNWGAYFKQAYRSGPPPFFEAVKRSASAAGNEPDLVNQLEITAAGQRRAALEEYVRSRIAMTIGLKSPLHIESRQRLFDAGIDSLMAVELKNRIEAGIGKALPATLVFDYPTVEALADFIETGALSYLFAGEPVKKELPAAEAADDAELDELLTEIGGVSDEELVAKLARRK